MEKQKHENYDIYTGAVVTKNAENKTEKTIISLEEEIRRQQERLLGKKVINRPVVKGPTIMPVR